MKNNTKQTIKIYLKALANYKTSVILSVLSIVAATVLGVAIPLYLKKFFDLLAGPGDKTTLAKNLVAVLLVIAGLRLGQWLAHRVNSFATIKFEAGAIADLSNSCFEYLHKHSFSFFTNNFVGSLVKKVKWFTKAFEAIADNVVWNLIPLFLSVGLIALVLLRQSLIIGGAMLGWTIIFLLINWAFIKYKLKYDIKRSKKETETTGFLADTVTGHNTIKLFNGYGRETLGFRKITEELRKIRKFTWDIQAFFDGLQGFLMLVLEVGMLYAAIILWRKSVLTIGDFALIQAYLIKIFQEVWDFGKVVRRIYENLADAEEMTEILNTPHEITDALKSEKIEVKKGEIEFKNVEFCYHRTRKMLKNFNLPIKSREKIALLGPSGSGKTTIAHLLLRLYDLTSGHILIDGQDISKITQESLRKNIGLVPQDPILFHRPLLENIRYGEPKASDEEVVCAAKLANCHQFIDNLPEKYRTFVGERGVKLSGGERQRVAIARAILKNAKILILDEATSSLDSKSESLIQKGLDNLMKEKTVIVIAHRLSTIKKMDRIIVLDKGRIIEEGTHNQLIAKKDGKYKILWELQAGGFIR